MKSSSKTDIKVGMVGIVGQGGIRTSWLLQLADEKWSSEPLSKGSLRASARNAVMPPFVTAANLSNSVVPVQ
jgi:hypothetical protein